ncbi:glutathione S-transferase family protein [Aurantiacibacter flavus]|uniref:Glutathione S-transferase family protein n=1 Tax=Aurantiacibacter flavus TaxID=3145232 RepID=A0ABV0CW43_9SPHN
MPQTANAPITISAFSWAPEFARGNVRDLPVRWMLEEIGRDYEVELLDAKTPRGPEYVGWHPFDQVPAYRDDEVEIFEAAAILLHLAEKSGQFLPVDAAGRAKAISWLFAAVNAVEPPLRNVTTFPLFYSDSDWAAPASEALAPFAEKRLTRVADALGANQWIAEEFSIADIMLTFILRTIGGKLIEAFPALVAYVERGKARPAYQRALAGQLADFADENAPA